MTAVGATLILALFFIAAVGMWADVCQACDEAQHELDLDELWDCVCGEINTRHCPVHGQGEVAA